MRRSGEKSSQESTIASIARMSKGDYSEEPEVVKLGKMKNYSIRLEIAQYARLMAYFAKRSLSLNAGIRMVLRDFLDKVERES